MATESKAKKTELTDEEFERIKRDSLARREREPYADSVRYDAAAGTVIVELRGGSRVVAKADEVIGLESATKAQRADVRVWDGRALFWDGLDVQHTLIAFIADALGVPTAAVIQSRGGKARTEAKAAAARANGAKGGRPRKGPAREKVAA